MNLTAIEYILLSFAMYSSVILSIALSLWLIIWRHDTPNTVHLLYAVTGFGIFFALAGYRESIPLVMIIGCISMLYGVVAGLAPTIVEHRNHMNTKSS